MNERASKNPLSTKNKSTPEENMVMNGANGVEPMKGTGNSSAGDPECPHAWRKKIITTAIARMPSRYGIDAIGSVGDLKRSSHVVFSVVAGDFAAGTFGLSSY